MNSYYLSLDTDARLHYSCNLIGEEIANQIMREVFPFIKKYEVGFNLFPDDRFRGIIEMSLKEECISFNELYPGFSSKSLKYQIRYFCIYASMYINIFEYDKEKEIDEKLMKKMKILITDQIIGFNFLRSFINLLD